MQEISEDQLKEEVQAYEAANIEDTLGADKRIARIQRKYQKIDGQQLGFDKEALMQRVDALCHSLDNLLSQDKVDLQCNINTLPSSVVKVPKGRERPDWAPAGTKNGRGQLKISPAHYSALVMVGGALTEAIVDTGGARTMLDANLAQELGLAVELAGPGKWFGSFWGPSAQPIPYYGQIAGPVQVRFSGNVVFTLPEIKVIQHGEKLALIGTDILGKITGGQAFESVGIDQQQDVGVMTFTNQGLKETVQLVHAPGTVEQNTERTAFNTDWDKQFLALLKQQGQCL